jgi:hypothetical protein
MLVPVTVVDGALVRLASDDTWTWVEQWMGPKRSWVKTTSTTIAEVMRGPTASPETLRIFLDSPT